MFMIFQVDTLHHHNSSGLVAYWMATNARWYHAIAAGYMKVKKLKKIDGIYSDKQVLLCCKAYVFVYSYERAFLSLTLKIEMLQRKTNAYIKMSQLICFGLST